MAKKLRLTKRQKQTGISVMDRLKPKKPRTVRLKVTPTPKKKPYKIPATPKNFGRGLR